MLSKKHGFTLIEILLIVAIIAILATIVLVSVNQSRKNARINNAKTSLRTVLPIVVSCLDSGKQVNNPSAGNLICQSGLPGSFWPNLSWSYQYGAFNLTNSNNCSFQVSTNEDTTNPLTCSCATQICQ